MKILIILLILLTVTAENIKMPFYKLPDNVLPIHYDIFITPNLTTFEFIGKEKIFINVLKPTKIITLNSIDINIKSASYNSKDKDTLVSQNVEHDTTNETIVIHFEQEISVEKGSFLNIEFDGKINEKLSGFYQSTYISNGLKKLAGVTQFAPTDARQCFPCWDEPGIKSTFSVNLIIPQNLLAISNMPIQSVSTNDSVNSVTVSFLKTPLMSTYLVAFIICDYDHIETSESNLIRLYAPKDNVHNGELSLAVAVKALSFYENYFKIKFPLPKLDLVSVADFSYGAMENWGLITLREAILLIDPQNSSTIKKQKAALTVAHELAHQWFGNLVTMEWWTHLWLNEGYASFMEYLCIDHIYPEYNIWAQFLTSVYIKALELDALANTHPIEVPIEKPSQIKEIFDQISYSKGASVIRMIHNYIGKDDFQRGMHLYLTKHSYSNVNTEDLWHALEEASNKPIGKIMSTWTKQSGFPLIIVTEKVANNPTNRVFTFSQEKFYVNGSVDDNNITWIIPITLSTSDTKNILETVILDEKMKDIEIKNLSHKSWFKVNAGSIGFFRTLYSPELLNNLLSGIQNHSLPTFDRLGLLDDLFTVAQSGRVSTIEFLKLLIQFKHENEYIVWSCIINNLRKIHHILLDFEDISYKFKIFGKNILSEIHSKLGWTAKAGENHLDTLLRVSVLSQLVDFDDSNILCEAQRLFQMHFKKETILPADFRGFVYQAVLSIGDIEIYNQIISLYKDTTVHEEKNRILSSLGSINNPELLQKVLEFSLTDEVRTQDVAKVFRSVAKNHKGRLLAWQYFKKNWNQIMNCCYGGTLLTNIIESVTENFVTEEIINDIEDFFNKTPILGIERTVKQCIETIRLNTAWLNRDKKSIEHFLTLNIKEVKNSD